MTPRYAIVARTRGQPYRYVAQQPRDGRDIEWTEKLGQAWAYAHRADAERDLITICRRSNIGAITVIPIKPEAHW